MDLDLNVGRDQNAIRLCIFGFQVVERESAKFLEKKKKSKKRKRKRGLWGLRIRLGIGFTDPNQKGFLPLTASIQ